MVAGTSGPTLGMNTTSAQPNPDKIWTAAAPLGRMWLMWATNDDRIYAVRSNRALTKWGPITRLTPPRDTTNTWGLDAEGSRGFADIVLNATVAGGTRFWHTRVTPQLTLTTTTRTIITNRARTAVFRVTDAGDPVRSAKVSFRGATRITNAAGFARFPVAIGKMTRTYIATARAGGYRPATTKVTLTPTPPRSSGSGTVVIN
jgi:hypothetical protein